MTIADSHPAADNSTPPRRILIVDDNAATAHSLSRVLQSAKFNTSVALRGSDALDVARAQNFDAALVDVHLPDLNGLVLSQKLRDLFGPRKPIIVVSGDTSMEVINALPHVGATYFFSKPLNPTYLIEHLREWIGAAAADAAPAPPGHDVP